MPSVGRQSRRENPPESDYRREPREVDISNPKESRERKETSTLYT